MKSFDIMAADFTTVAYLAYILTQTSIYLMPLLVF